MRTVLWLAFSTFVYQACASVPLPPLPDEQVWTRDDFQSSAARMASSRGDGKTRTAAKRRDASTAAGMSPEERDEIALDYMLRYNYAGEVMRGSKEAVRKSDLVKMMQRNFGLALTGEIDDDTITTMLAPRCGFPDNFRIYDKRTKYNKDTVTYRFINYSPDLSVCETRNTIKRAMRLWEEQIELNFVEEEDEDKDVDMDIKFGYGRHGVNECRDCPFDGKGKTLAHAFSPVPGWTKGYNHGDMHFDEAETWAEENKPSLITYNGNAEGAPCVFPFVYKNRTFAECTRADSSNEWCATTDNFDRDGKYGLCPSEELFTYGGNGEGKPCSFPFIYHGKVYEKCTTDWYPSDGYAWCSTTSNFDKDQLYGFCPTRMNQIMKETIISLHTTAAHEIGHAIGLNHSQYWSALMYGRYRYQELPVLPQDDIKGIQYLYGGPRKSLLPKLDLEVCGGTIKKLVPLPTTPMTTTTVPAPDICQLHSIDAAMYDGNDIYLFKGENYWVLSKDRSDKSGAKKILDLFSHGPGTVDAIYNRPQDRATFVFSGKDYYTYFQEFHISGPEPYSSSLGITENINAVFNWRNHKYKRFTHYFSKDKVYRYNERKSRLVRRFPKSVERWDELLVDVDAAMAHAYYPLKTWFFKGNSVYLYDDEYREVYDDATTFKRWLGCDN